MAKVTLKISEFLEGGQRGWTWSARAFSWRGWVKQFMRSGTDTPDPGCSLSKGALAATIIACPCHGSKFDITTGKAVARVGKHPILGELTSFMKKGVPVHEPANIRILPEAGPDIALIYRRSPG
jgi:nitrite reductase/ring-hydroxylating ferredoxin subunit